MRRVLRAAGLVLLACGLGGCGNKEKSELYVGLQAIIAEPEFMQAMMRVDVAGTVALMNLTAEQATILGNWAEEHGGAVRQLLTEKLAELGGSADQMRQAADALVTERAATLAEQKALREERLGPDNPIDRQEPPLQIDELIAPHLEALAPVVEQLSDRQQLVALGGWNSVAEAVAADLAADAIARAATRADLANRLVQARGLGFFPAEEVRQQAERAVEEVMDGGGEVEELVAALFAALPAEDAAKQRAEAGEALASLLCCQDTAELLALVP